MGVSNRPTSPRTRALVIATGVVATTLVVAWGTLRPPDNAFDDAYITYRYADNLRRGLGLVYNPGEWVLGTTTPLYAMLLGLLGLVTADLEMMAHWLGVFGWILSVWAAMTLLWHAKWPRAGLVAGLMLAIEPSFLPNLGMETHILVALMLGVAWAWLSGRKWLTVFLAAALLLIRQDSALWLLLLGLEVWRRERSFPWREGVSTVLLASPWFAFAWWRYGSILPNSVHAKLAQHQLMPVTGQSSFWDTFLKTGTAGIHPLAVGIMVAATVLGIWALVRYARTLWWLVGWTILYVAIYAWLDVGTFPWYFVPPLTVATLVMALGFGYLLGDRAHSGERTPETRGRIGSRLPAAFGILLLLALLLNRGAHMRATSTCPGYSASYVPVGRWLADNTPADSTVASIEIGVIGYISRRPILDTMGLVSPDMARHQLGWVETLAYALNVHQPDYAVALRDTAWDGIVDRWWFRERYEPVAHFGETTIYGRRQAPDEMIEMPLQINYVDGLTVNGATVNSDAIRPAMTLEVWLHVHVQSPPPASYQFTLYLADAQTHEYFGVTTAEPFDGRYDSLRWQAGDQLAIPMRLKVPDDLQPGTYRLGIIVYDIQREAGLPLRDLPGVANPDVRVGWFRLGSPPRASAPSQLKEQPLKVRWENGIELTAIWLPSQPLAAGAGLRVQFAWQTSQPLSRDLTVFVHLVNAQGEIVAQQDRPPFHGRWPTPVWRPGEVLRDTYELELPDALPASRYALRFGFYDQAGRLMLGDESGDYWLVPDAVQVEGQPLKPPTVTSSLQDRSEQAART